MARFINIYIYIYICKRDRITTHAGGEIYSTVQFTNVLVTIWSCVVAIETLWYYLWPPLPLSLHLCLSLSPPSLSFSLSLSLSVSPFLSLCLLFYSTKEVGIDGPSIFLHFWLSFVERFSLSLVYSV